MACNPPDWFEPEYRDVRGWKVLVTSEREWLVRPAVWGLGILPEAERDRKTRQFYSCLAERLLRLSACEWCQEIARAFGEAERDFASNEAWPRPLRRVAVAPVEHSPCRTGSPGCPGGHIGLHLRHFDRGNITETEFHASIWDAWQWLVFQRWENAGRDRAVYDAEHASMLETERFLMSDLLGNPYRPTKADPACLAWNNYTVVRIAQNIRGERNFALYSVLADALEEAGCTHPDILGHCRLKREHVLGCWVLDALLFAE